MVYNKGGNENMSGVQQFARGLTWKKKKKKWPAPWSNVIVVPKNKVWNSLQQWGKENYTKGINDITNPARTWTSYEWLEATNQMASQKRRERYVTDRTWPDQKSNPVRTWTSYER
jgi:hypothetical protein